MEQKKKYFLKELAKFDGNIGQACKISGVNRSTLCHWQKNDEAFAHKYVKVMKNIVDIAEMHVASLQKREEINKIIADEK